MTRVDIEDVPGARVFDLRVHRDARGMFVELWRDDRRRGDALPSFVQDNVAVSASGVLRGLHYQHPRAQGKLVSVTVGEVFDVIVDVRRGSPTFAKWAACELSARNGRQLFVPPGVAHGYLALDGQVVLVYKCTEYYDPAVDRAISWADPDLAIEWPIASPELSPRDRAAPLLRDIAADELPALAS